MSKSPISKRLRTLVARDARQRCGYCQCQEAIIGMELEIDHFDPEANDAATVRRNLWLACGTCNKRKSQRLQVTDPETDQHVRLFNPRTDNWNEHFERLDGGEIIKGRTAIGRAMVAALRLNDPPIRIAARRRWIAAG